MLISSLDLINLPVFTQSGQNLGRVAAFDINVDTNVIACYYVKTGLIKGLWHQQLAIAPGQIISISKEKMVIEDNVKSQPVGEMELAAPAVK